MWTPWAISSFQCSHDDCQRYFLLQPIFVIATSAMATIIIFSLIVAALWQPLSWRPMSVNIYSHWSTVMSTFDKETNVMDTKKENIYNNIVHADKSTRGWSLRDHINVTFVGRFSATVIFHVGGVGWVIRLPCSTRVNLIDPLSAGPANIPRWRAWRRFFMVQLGDSAALKPTSML